MRTRPDQNADRAPAGGSDEAFAVKAPPVTLPKGGGAIRGIGEKFAANPVTGTGSMSVPIATSPGRSGFGPQLSLSYDSGAGNGPFGFGWSLSLPSITRKTDKGLPQYRDGQEQEPDSDVFILSGSEDLVPVFRQDAQGNWLRDAQGNLLIQDDPRAVGNQTYRVRRYRPRLEGLFARIERWTNTADATEVFWRSISKDDITTWYGRTANSRVADPAERSRIFTWLICETHDDKGNVVAYGYKPENSSRVLEDAAGHRLAKAHERNRTDASRSAPRYLKRIRYGNRLPYFPTLKANEPWPEPPDAPWPQLPASQPPTAGNSWLFEVVLDYGEHHALTPGPGDAGIWPVRSDPFSSYRAGFEVRTYRICQPRHALGHLPQPHARSADGPAAQLPPSAAPMARVPGWSPLPRRRGDLAGERSPIGGLFRLRAGRTVGGAGRRRQMRAADRRGLPRRSAGGRGTTTAACHRFEWSRAEFAAWAEGVAAAHGYTVRFAPIGRVHPRWGAPTQLASFALPSRLRAQPPQPPANVGP